MPDGESLGDVPWDSCKTSFYDNTKLLAQAIDGGAVRVCLTITSKNAKRLAELKRNGIRSNLELEGRTCGWICDVAHAGPQVTGRWGETLRWDPEKNQFCGHMSHLQSGSRKIQGDWQSFVPVRVELPGLRLEKYSQGHLSSLTANYQYCYAGTKRSVSISSPFEIEIY